MIKFANPAALFLLIGIPILIIFFWTIEKRKQILLARFGEIELIKKLTLSRSKGFLLARRIIFTSAMVFIALAMARPQLGTKLEEVKREGIDLIVAIDVSNSMLAEDVAPSRMAKARHELKTLIEKLQGDRIGIVAFAGDAFLASPLTTDYGAALMILDALDVGVIPQQGTAIARAIEVARKGFIATDNRQKVLLLLTDGEDHEGKPIEAAEVAAEEGIIIYCVGIGSPTGVPIPTFDGYGNKSGYLRDSGGEIVTSKLDEVTLQRMVLATDGKYYAARPGAAELNEIIKAISGMEKSEIEAKIFTNFEDRFQWFLIPAILLIIIAGAFPERRIERRIKRKASLENTTTDIK